MLLLAAILLGMLQASFAVNQSTEIPGTGLKTRTFYQIKIREYAHGLLTWTNEGDSQFNYIQHNRDIGSSEGYQPGGKFYQDAMWEFVPDYEGGTETGWYKLRNRGRCGAYVTFQPYLDKDESQKQVQYMILENKYRGIAGRQDGDLLLKPVKVTANGQVYYKLVLKNKPTGVVTNSFTKYSEGGVYIVVNTDPTQAPYFEEGGKWYGTNLFSIGELQRDAKLDAMDEGECRAMC